MSDDNQAKFLLALLKNGSFEPDWKATAKDLGINNGHNVERQACQGGTPITPDATTGGSIPQAPKKPTRKAEPGAKRRKSNTGKVLKTEAEVKDEAEDEAEAEAKDKAEDEHTVDDQDRKLDGDPNSGESGETA